ncbi:MAG: aminoglycoside 6'-N-acetyltransferase [Cyanobacteria bacterium P01_F01_bin.3]
MIERCASIEQPGWLSLRKQLWPDCSHEKHLAEMSSFLAEPSRYVQFVAYDGGGSPTGFAEAALRSDYVNGTSSSPVAFLEGIYVVSRLRRQGIAARLVVAVAEWAIAQGCRELASDALLDNELSQIFHKALGFKETERVVFFCKSLR